MQAPGNPLIARASATLTASYAAASATTLLFSGIMTVPAGTSLLSDDGHTDIALLATIGYPLVAVNLANLLLKNGSGGVAYFVGGARGPAGAM